MQVNLFDTAYLIASSTTIIKSSKQAISCGSSHSVFTDGTLDCACPIRQWHVLPACASLAAYAIWLVYHSTSFHEHGLRTSFFQ